MDTTIPDPPNRRSRPTGGRPTRRKFLGAGGIALLATTSVSVHQLLSASPAVAEPNLPIRLATAGSGLAAGVDATETALLVATASGERLWSHADNFTVDCDGEVMTVTHIEGDVSPQTFTVVRSVNQVVSSHPPNAAVQITNVETL